MKQKEILRHTGTMEQLAYVRRMFYGEGAAKNSGVFSFNNGVLSFSVALDHGMDIDSFQHKGQNIAFLSKAGLHGNSADYSRNIMCGMMFTCGLDNIGVPTETSPQHGRIRAIPAEHTASRAFWKDGSYRLECEGNIRQGTLFGESLLLHRRIYTELHSSCITLEDEITNNSFRDEPISLMYHFNFGYPLVCEGTQLVIPSKCCTPRNEDTRKAMANTSPYIMDAPVDNHPEQVFFHKLCADENRNTFCALINPDRDLAVKLSFSLDELPYFTQWKSIGSGDYVIGLEPGFTSLDDAFSMPRLAPDAKIHTRLTLEVIDDKTTIASLQQNVDVLLKMP